MSVQRVSFDEWKQDLDSLALTVKAVADMEYGSAVELAVISRKGLDSIQSFGEFREEWVVMTLEKMTFVKTGLSGSSIEGTIIEPFSIEMSEGVWAPVQAMVVDFTSTSRLGKGNDWLVPIDALNARAQGRGWNIVLA